MRILSILGWGAWRIRLLYPGRGPNNPSHSASSSCCFSAEYRSNQPCCVRNEGCCAMQRPPVSPLRLLLRPVLPGFSLLFAQKSPDETLVWRECRPDQLQTGIHLSPGSPESQTVLYACACSCPLYVACKCRKMLCMLFALCLPLPVCPSFSLPTIPVHRDGNASSLRSNQTGMVGFSASPWRSL